MLFKKQPNSGIENRADHDQKREPGQIWLFFSLVGFAVCMRFLPHMFNVTPIMAVALLSGFHFRNKSIALLVPLSAMFLSDLFIGLHSLLLFIYAPILISVLLGNWMYSQNSEKAWPVKQSLQLSVLGSVLFFVSSNLGVFFLAGMYPFSFLGLTECFSAALPFFERSLLGDLMFTTCLFSIYSFVRQTYPNAFGSRELSRG